MPSNESNLDLLMSRGIPEDQAQEMLTSIDRHGAQHSNAPARAVLAELRSRPASNPTAV